MPSGPLQTSKATYFSFGCVTTAYLPRDPKSCSFCIGTRIGDSSATRLLEVAGPLGPHDLQDPMVLEGAVADRDAV